MKRIFTLALVAVSLLALSCGSSGPVDVKVPVSALTLRDTTCVIDYSYPAKLAGYQDVAIYPMITERIEAVKVKEGDYVKVGQELFRLVDDKYIAELDAAVAEVEVEKAKVANAMLTLESKQRLFDRNVISEYQLKLAQNDLYTSRASLQRAQASAETARTMLSYTRILSPANGYIGSLPYKVGSMVSPTMSEPMTMVSDNSQMYADFSLPENMYLQIAENFDIRERSGKGQLPKVSLVMNNGHRYKEKGEVSVINGLFSQKTGALPVRALFPNKDAILLSGGAGKVVFSIQSKNLIVVPRAAMKEIQNKLYVFKIVDSVLVQTPVEAERMNASEWLITPDKNGEIALKPGDIITTTVNRLKNGDVVTIVE